MNDESAHFPHHTESQDEFWMRAALDEAQKCLRSSPQPSAPNTHKDDVPVGAVCVRGKAIIVIAHNRRELDNDPTAHAELLALREAARVLNKSHLNDVTLYVTLEPCVMCAGAIWLARVGRVVFGAWDKKAGACGSMLDVPRDPRLNHRPQVRGGVLESECEAILRTFFEARRNK